MFKQSVESVTRKVNEMTSDLNEVRDSLRGAVPKLRPVRRLIRNRVKRARR